LWITRAAVCEYRKHINLYRVRRPSACQRRHFAICSLQFVYPHVYTLLPFSSFPALLSPFGPSYIIPLKPNPPSHSFCPFFRNVSFSCLLAYVGDGRIFLTSNLNLRHLRWGAPIVYLTITSDNPIKSHLTNHLRFPQFTGQILHNLQIFFYASISYIRPLASHILFSSSILLSPLGPSSYITTLKPNPPSNSFCHPYFRNVTYSCLLALPVLLFSSIAFSIRSLPLLSYTPLLPPIFFCPHYKHVTHYIV